MSGSDRADWGLNPCQCHPEADDQMGCGGDLLSKFMPISFLSGAYLAFEVLHSRKGIKDAGSFLSRFTGVHLVFVAFQTRVEHFCFLPCLLKIPLLICDESRMSSQISWPCQTGSTSQRTNTKNTRSQMADRLRQTHGHAPHNEHIEADGPKTDYSASDDRCCAHARK